MPEPPPLFLVLPVVLWFLALVFDLASTFKCYRLFNAEKFFRCERNLLFKQLLLRFSFPVAGALYGLAEAGVIIILALTLTPILNNLYDSFLVVFAGLCGLHFFAALNNLAIANI